MRIPLETINPPAPRKRNGEDYIPALPRPKARSLADRACSARTIQEAAAILRAEALTLPSDGEWSKGLLRLASWLLSRKGAPPFQVFIVDGNSKVPFAVFSTLPATTCPGAGECLEFCYSFTSWKNTGAYLRQLQNTLLMKFRPSYVRSAFYALDYGLTVRLYVDGDFANVAEVRMWMEAIGNRPDLKCYGYSKSWDEFLEYARTSGFPSNYVLNLSSGSKHGPEKAARMEALSCVRKGGFTAVQVDYRGNVSAEKKYADPVYHAKTRAAGRAAGFGKPFSCPGKCGECTPRGHACGSHEFDGMTIVIGVH